MKILKYALAAFAAGVTLSAHACAILEFGAENLLFPDQNTLEINFQEVKAFAASRFPTQFMGPSENGAIALLSLTSSGRLYQRSGMNSVARGKMRSSVIMRQKIYQVVSDKNHLPRPMTY